ncbi:hypothetical protein C0991_004665, partial [Blastosporella zonata]
MTWEPWHHVPSRLFTDMLKRTAPPRLLVLFLILFSLVFASPSASKHEKLVYGLPTSVGLLPEPLVDLEKNVSGYMVAADYGSASYYSVHSLYPGATVLIGHDSTIVSHFAVGQSKKYADVNGTFLPEEEWIDTQKDTIYDMASLTKMFTSIVAMQQLDAGEIALNATVATYLPEFSVNGKENVTFLQLFTHTSGFNADPVPGLWTGWDTYDERKAAVIASPLLNAPGTAYLYSDLNFMTMQFVLERVTGLPLDTLIEQHFTGPLGMHDTWFNRGNKKLPYELLKRVAVTEYQIAVLGDTEPEREQPVWGTVHDENAWSLDGVAGHAGIYSTAGDLAIFCQMILNNGTYDGVKILEPSTVDLIFHDYNGAQFPGDNHGLGFELNQYYWSGPMQSLQTAGHTGFTGTTMAIDR